MDNLAKLKLQKAELKAQIEQERYEIKSTMLEIRAEIEPANLLKKAVNGVLGLSKNKIGDEKTGLTGQLPAPLSLAVDLLVRDPRLSLAVKWIAPLAMKYLPKLIPSRKAHSLEIAEKPVSKPMKVKLYSRLRSGISSLRRRLRKSEELSESNTDQLEN